MLQVHTDVVSCTVNTKKSPTLASVVHRRAVGAKRVRRNGFADTQHLFGRFRHNEFAVFLRYSRGSLFEISDGLRDDVKRKYWTPPMIREALTLST